MIELVEATGRKAVSAPGDLSTEEGNIDLAQKAVEELGHIDVLVSVAGKQVYVEDIADLTTEQSIRPARPTCTDCFG